MHFLALLAALFLTTLPAHAQEGFASNVTLADGSKTVPTNELRFPDGTQGSLGDYRGNVIVVTMWEIRCPFCQKEMPVLDRLAADMASEGVRVVPLSVDQDMSAITAHLDRMNWPNLKPIMDVDALNGLIMSVEHFGRMSVATPTTFIADKDGRIVATIWGLVDWDGDAARDYLRSLAAG